MTGTTDNPNDPDLTHGADTEPVDQARKYLVLSEAERSKGFLRPLRLTYIHEVCGSVTSMSQSIAETYARNPYFYGSTYCATCRMHKPVGPDGEFTWDGTNMKVGT
jgi:hypothetical protein